ncbi:hypothetical protein Dimus_018215 [Dionaea muscipula]
MAEITAEDSTKYGFERPEMYSLDLTSTVDPPFDRHVFLCYKNYSLWPPRVEGSESDPLPKLFSSALKARKDDIKVKTRLTICEADAEVGLSDGDVLVFPQLTKYRGLKESNVDAFVDDVLVNGKPWASGEEEELKTGFVFVCAHASRDKRCGVCGPVLIEKFKEEIRARNMNDMVLVSACSHIGGHKYAGNVIIFSSDSEGEVAGDWYGYVTPKDVGELLEAHFYAQKIVQRLWRGGMGMHLDLGLGLDLGPPVGAKENGVSPVKEKKWGKSKGKPVENGSQEITENVSSCCQGANGVSCCSGGTLATNGDVEDVKSKVTLEGKGKKACVSLPAWMGKWDQSDVLMSAAVIGAVATVAVAYSFYKRSG